MSGPSICSIATQKRSSIGSYSARGSLVNGPLLSHGPTGGMPKNVTAFFGHPGASVPVGLYTATDVLTLCTTKLLEVASAMSGGAQPPKYGQIDAESRMPANFVIAKGEG